MPLLNLHEAGGFDALPQTAEFFLVMLVGFRRRAGARRSGLEISPLTLSEIQRAFFLEWKRSGRPVEPQGNGRSRR